MYISLFILRKYIFNKIITTINLFLSYEMYAVVVYARNIMRTMSVLM